MIGADVLLVFSMLLFFVYFSYIFSLQMKFENQQVHAVNLEISKIISILLLKTNDHLDKMLLEFTCFENLR